MSSRYAEPARQRAYDLGVADARAGRPLNVAQVADRYRSAYAKGAMSAEARTTDHHQENTP